MKLSLNWLKDYVELPTDLDIDTLTHDLTMSTVEVEDVVNPAEALDGIVIGTILEVDAHPNADRLRICQTDVGGDAPSQIVCGGSNLRAGQKVAVAVPGAMVRWHGEGEPVEIKSAKLRGVRSEGMICGASELGLEALFPVDREDEIMDLTAWEAAPGTPLGEALELKDQILEIDNKSMTNRPDLWGHYGMARELAAIYGTALKPLPAMTLPDEIRDYPVEIREPKDCRRYIAAVYEGVENAPAPYWMRRRLWSVGQRPINQLVDITNYVMMATGQPTHGFDETHVKGGIIVRRAEEGEELELLDRSKLQLSPEDLAICDHRGPLALAGVMGGRRDSILDTTDRLVLEVANFDALRIRRTAARYDHRTEASTRFEKAIDSARCDQALAMTDDLIRRLMPDAKLIAYQDNYPKVTPEPEVDVKLSFLASGLGREVTAEEVTKLLEPLGFEVGVKDDADTNDDAETSTKDVTLTIRVPSWRGTGDVSMGHDILEEVARMIGYDNFDFVPPKVTLEGAVHQPRVETERKIREYLAHRCGFREIFTYPWVDDQYIEAAGLGDAEHLTLATPPAPTERRLRRSTVPGLLEAIRKNRRYRDRFNIFEMTEVFLPTFRDVPHSPEKLPEQPLRLGAAWVAPEDADPLTLLRVARGAVEALPRAVMIEPVALRAGDEAPAWADSKGWLDVVGTKSGEVLGKLGILSLKAMADADIRRARVAILELDVEALTPLPSRDNGYARLPLYPLVEEDLSMVVDEDVSWQEIEAAVRRQQGVKDVRFMEEYRGHQIPEGKRSVMFRYWIGSDEKTLTAEEIDQMTATIIKKVGKATGAVIRS